MQANPLFQGRTVTGSVTARITIDGREYINFFGSRYLALSDLPEVKAAVLAAIQRGVPYSQQIPAELGVEDPEFDAVERAAAVACGTEASVYLPSGYLIGMALFASLQDRFDHVLIDKEAHYSLQDATKMAGLPVFTFEHGDAQSLADTLKRNARAGRRPLVVTDGVFATTGRVPPLADYASLIEPYDGRLLVDESHAFGVVGANGHGATEHCGVERMAVAGASLSKAFCAQGAVIACSAQRAAELRSIPPIRGACAGSPLSAAAATASLRYSADHPELREKLRQTAEYLRARLRKAGLDIIDTPAPIVSFKWGSRAVMLELQRRAWDRGVCIYHSTYLGAGPDGMIRCGIFRDHSPADIDALLEALEST